MKANGGAKIVNGVVDLTSLNGELTVRNAALDGRSYGNLSVTAATRLPLLSLTATATLGDVQLRGSGEWRMEKGEVHLGRLVLTKRMCVGPEADVEKRVLAVLVEKARLRFQGDHLVISTPEGASYEFIRSQSGASQHS